MKTYFIMLIFTWSIINAQNPFLFSINEPKTNIINDAIQYGDRIFCLSDFDQLTGQPWEYYGYSKFISITDEGEFIDSFRLSEDSIEYQRIFKIAGENLFILGGLQTDSCHLQIILSTYNILTHEVHHLPTYLYCNNILIAMRVDPGLDELNFIDILYYNLDDQNLHKSIFRIDSLYQIQPVFEDISSYEYSFSIDFAGTGYVMCAEGLYKFYDRNLQYRKTISTPGEITTGYETHVPFGNHLILEEARYYDHDEGPGIYIKLVDSNLVIKHQAVIYPSPAPVGDFIIPDLQGLDIINHNEIWAASSFGLFPYLHPSIFGLTKLDSNLNIICQHFFGYDAQYLLRGIRALPSGGAMAFGSLFRPGDQTKDARDVFACRVGENCELPATSLDDPGHPIYSISVYPNPTINELTFEVNGFDPASLDVEIFNTSGQVVFSKHDLSYEIAVSDLPAGTYFYRILQKDKILGVGSWVKD